MLAVTTFPEWAWEAYAKSCVESVAEYWPGSILAYYEGNASPPEIPGVEFRPLNMKERDRFLSYKVKGAPNHFLFDAHRFCHKVFAQLDALQDKEPVWWIDADVEMRKPLPIEKVEKITSRSFVSFLGRDSYTETGVIAFNPKHEGFQEFEDRYRSCYEELKLYQLPYWTDCHAFDYARDEKGDNLTPWGQGFENVLIASELGEYMTHHKGNLKFRRSA